jgi:hypothetical protein
MVDRKKQGTRASPGGDRGLLIEEPPNLVGPRGKGNFRPREEVVERYRRRLEEVEAEVEQVCAEHSDRAQILLGCVMIERRLDQVIADRVPEGVTPKPHSLGAKVDLALALGVVGSELANTIKGAAAVRNKAAHTLDANSFSHPEIERLCKLLNEPNAEATKDQYRWSVNRCCLELDSVWAVVRRIEPYEPDFQEDTELHALGIKHGLRMVKITVLGIILDAQKEED